MNTKRELYEKWQQMQYYIIIGVVSAVALFFLPMLGSSIGLAFVLPNTVAGWIVYITSKLLVAALNVIIFHCFVLQAKVNIKDNENYLAAVAMLKTINADNDFAPRSPEEYMKGIYGKKGIAIFITTALAAIGLTQAVLTFSWVSMLSYLFTVLMGVIFGILQMNQTEIYWIEEFYQYARKVVESQTKCCVAMAAPQISEQNNDTADNIGGSDILVTSNSCGASGTDSIA